MINSIKNRKELILGWSVNDLFEPIAWTSGQASNLDNLEKSNLVCVDPVDMGTHLCILAQSGSGKSYILGRILEELRKTSLVGPSYVLVIY
jgi:DNA helicase HerA-like ATPase